MPRSHTSAAQTILDREIQKFFPHLPVRTSRHLNWCGVEVHRYRLAAGETREHAYPRLGVFLSHCDGPIHGELRLAGKRIKKQLGNHTVSVAPPGLPHSASWDTPNEVTSIFLDPLTVAEIAMAETGSEHPELIPQYGIDDPLLRSIGSSLDAELVSPAPRPRIYAESLATAIAAHVFACYAKLPFHGFRQVGHNRTQLRRGVEFMHDNLTSDLTLAEIAAAANMSKYHFAKSFRQAMGMAPHQYLVKLRIDKSRKLLANDALSLEEVAVRVGYSDKGHFAAQFTKLMGMSPNRYRLNG